jgi:hypothetical protein
MNEFFCHVIFRGCLGAFLINQPTKQKRNKTLLTHKIISISFSNLTPPAPKVGSKSLLFPLVFLINISKINIMDATARCRHGANVFPITRATSTIRFENPHSLSYQDNTRTNVPSITCVCVASKVELAGL